MEEMMIKMANVIKNIYLFILKIKANNNYIWEAYLDVKRII